MIEAADLLAARDRFGDVVRRSPLVRSTTFSGWADAEVHLKLEAFQRTGSFKIRGAMNRISTLAAAEADAGVVTASGGNHAQGVALAAAMQGIESVIVMPEETSRSKVRATAGYGADVRLHGETYNAAAARAHEIERETGRTYIHAFEDPAVIAGQGTVGLEILEDLPTVGTIAVPIGGGGLIGGIATAAAGHDRPVRVVGVQAAGATAAERSVHAGRVVELEEVSTIAEGMATRHIGEHTLELIQARVDDLVTVTDEEMTAAIGLLLDRSKTLAEPAGAAAVAALLAGRLSLDTGEVVVPLVSGGNLDLEDLARMAESGVSTDVFPGIGA